MPGPPRWGWGGRLEDGKYVGLQRGVGGAIWPQSLRNCLFLCCIQRAFPSTISSLPFQAQGVISCLEMGGMGLAAGGRRGKESLRSLPAREPLQLQHPPWLPPPSYSSLRPAQPHTHPLPPTPSAQGRGHRHFVPTQVPLTEVIEPLDFEDVLLSQPPDAEPGPLRDLVEFPADDVELLLQPRECRTTEPGIPEDEWVQPQALPVHNSTPPPCTRPFVSTPFPIKLPTAPNSTPGSSV